MQAMAQSRILLPEKRGPDGSMENTNRGLRFVFPSSIRIR